MNLFTKIGQKLSYAAEQRRKRRVIGSLLERAQEPLVRIGSHYGGWTVPESVLAPGGTAICVGAGEDITFDVELNRRGLRVFTVDPTPRSAAHVRDVLEGAATGRSVAVDYSTTACYDFAGFDPSRLKFFKLGLSDKNSVLRFWAPKNSDHVSHSLVNLQQTDDYFEADCVRLQDLCMANGIDSIDILKLNIEGAEYVVLNDLTAGTIRPRAVCVDFDEGFNHQDSGYLERIADAVRQMQRAGYRPVKVEAWNLTFAYQPGTAGAELR
jgi:FkbM family methyltransferase